MKKMLFVSVILLAVLISACEPSMGTQPPREADSVETQRQQTEQLSNEARTAASEFGYSVEAYNLAERIRRDNDPAHIEYVYIISPFTGQVILQATAVGKATSTTKRLDPPQAYQLQQNVDCGSGAYCDEYLEFERVGPDGTYGTSTPGIVWYDTSGQKMEAKVGSGAIIISLERPYVFEEGKALDLNVDIRLQGQLDENREAQRERIVKWIKDNPNWRPGDEIPIDVMKGDN